jgi:hypothetical protein
VTTVAEKINFIDLRRDQFAETLFLRSIVMWQDAAGEKIPHTPGKDMDVRVSDPHPLGVGFLARIDKQDRP